MNIHPLGEQIIIRTVPTDSIGSIIVPDSAKGITLIGEKGGADDSLHFVEAEVIAVGPGKRKRGDATLLQDVSEMVQKVLLLIDAAQSEETDEDYLQDLWAGLEPLREPGASIVHRANLTHQRIPPLVKPGDRILYHPAVQKFDRDITDVMVNGDSPPIPGSQYFMIREESVLAVIER